ncbi:ribonuclease H-like domain-containing protein [Tanacetum coccineum]
MDKAQYAISRETQYTVIVNGDAPALASASVEGPIPPKTAKQKLARKNELKKDANLKLLRSLPSAWNNIALIMRNKSDLDTLSMDVLYNNLKVYESEIKVQLSSSSNSHNVAFVSSENTSSTNEAVNTAREVSTASSQEQSYVDDVMFSFFANQYNSPQLDNEDMEQIDTNDLKEMDLKWQVAMLIMRVKRFINNTRMNLNFNGKETVGFDKTEVECYNCHRRGHFARECRAPRNQGFQAEEGPIDFALMAHLSSSSSSSSSSDSEVRDNSITELKNQLAEALKEKDDLKLKLEKFETSSKKLTKLINSQTSVNNKFGVGFDSQMNENELHDCHLNKSKVFESASDSSMNEIEEENNKVNDRFKKVEGYHAVPPPYTGNYMPSRPDLSFAGLDDSVYKTNVSETISSVPRIESTASKSSKDSLEQPKDVRPSAPIIEEWESDNENTRKFVIEQHTYRQAENLRKSQSPRIDKRNWNGIMTQKLRDCFEFNKKACFVYNHKLTQRLLLVSEITFPPLATSRGQKNDIIRRPRIREIQAVPSTTHGMLKFPVDGGIVTIRSTILIPTKCVTVITSSKEILKEAEVHHENFKVALHTNFPDQEVAIRGTLSAKG